MEFTEGEQKNPAPGLQFQAASKPSAKSTHFLASLCPHSLPVALSGSNAPPVWGWHICSCLCVEPHGPTSPPPPAPRVIRNQQPPLAFITQTWILAACTDPAQLQACPVQLCLTCGCPTLCHCTSKPFKRLALRDRVEKQLEVSI